jgi:hypothetical protein
MDYRKIESRDRSPSVGYSMVQYKAAAEMCANAITEDSQSLLGSTDPDASPSDDHLDATLADWFIRVYARPWDAVPEADRALVRTVFRQVESKAGAAEAYMSTCAVLLASQDFALY